MHLPVLTRAAAVALVVVTGAACSGTGAQPGPEHAAPGAAAVVPAATPSPTGPAPSATPSATTPSATTPSATTAAPVTAAPAATPGARASQPSPPATPEIPRPEYPTAEYLGLPTTLEREGALEFAVYFVQVLDHMSRTQEVDLMRNASLPSCEFCQELMEAQLEGERAGDQVDGSRVWFKAATLDEYDEAARYARLTVESTETQGHVLGRNGEVVADIPHTEFVETLELTWSDGTWRVSWYE